jgi:hypothetical protein
MKSLILKSTMFLGAAAIIGLGAQAQTLHADIPFEFHANGKSMPAGSYVITTASTSNNTVYTMKNAGAHAGVIVNALRTIHENENGPVRLVFDRAADGYYLTEMWDTESGRALASPRGKSSFVADARVSINAK